MPTYKELLAQKEALEAQLEQVRQAEVAEVIAKIQDAMAIYGLTPDDLMPKRKTSKGSLPPLYQDPKTGKTWSGRGREPSWLIGKNRDKFRIAE